MVSERIAICPGPRTSYLDHLIPLCHKFEMPLLCTDPWVYTCAQHFYPETEVILEDPKKILPDYNVFYTVEPCRLHPQAFQFGNYIYRGEGTTVAGFHGNPYKFRDDYWIERYVDEDHVLIYGQYLIDYFKEKGVWDRLKQTTMIGNLRLEFYHQHQTFFDRVIEPHLFPNRDRKTVLYAPTWSFPTFDLDLGEIPESLQVIVKLHPYLYRLYPEKITEYREKYCSDQILFLDEIPLIYPLLSQVDYYLGDYSSVSYDFLAMNRPLFFFQEGLAPISHQHSSRFGQIVLSDVEEKPEGRVKLTLPRDSLKADGESDDQSGRMVGEKWGLGCGEVIQSLDQILETEDQFEKERKTLYNYVYG